MPGQLLRHKGVTFDAASFDSAIATRAITQDLRAGMNGMRGGPEPSSKAGVGAEGGDGQRSPARSNFLQALNRVLVSLGAFRRQAIQCGDIDLRHQNPDQD